MEYLIIVVFVRMYQNERNMNKSFAQKSEFIHMNITLNLKRGE